jgi:hypothetical protein
MALDLVRLWVVRWLRRLQLWLLLQRLWLL